MPNHLPKGQTVKSQGDLLLPVPARPRAQLAPPRLLGSALGSAAGGAPHLRTHRPQYPWPRREVGQRASQTWSNPSLVTLSSPFLSLGLHPSPWKMGGWDRVYLRTPPEAFRGSTSSLGQQPLLVLTNPRDPRDCPLTKQPWPEEQGEGQAGRGSWCWTQGLIMGTQR